MMNKFVLVFLLVLVVGLLSCESRELEKPLAPDYHHNSTSGPISNDKQFEYFMFAMQWPPTYCNPAIRKCRRREIPGRFTIHGLWPQSTGTEGQNRLTDAILKQRKAKLLQYWPDLKTDDFETSKEFWRREYKKHGVFCTQKYSVGTYFDRALAIGEAYQPLDWLAKKNIKPDASEQYDPAVIVSAIQSATGVRPNLQCYIIEEKLYLLEVRICLNDALTELVHCDGGVGQCQGPVYFPPAPAQSEASDKIIEEGEDLAKLIYQVV